MANRSYIWDETKAAANLAKHGIAFDKATEVFDDPLHYEFPDVLHSDVEIRRRVIGTLRNGRVVVVVFTLTRTGQTRLISARQAMRIEIRLYMNRPDELRDRGPDEDLQLDEDIQLDEDDVDLSTLDWSKAIRGGTVRLKRGPEWVRLENHNRVLFQGNDEVNAALEQMVDEHRLEIDFERRFARELAEEAVHLFKDPLFAWFEDKVHLDDEDRFRGIGTLAGRGVVVVVYAITNKEQTRIFSARDATRSEIRCYMNGSDELRDALPEVDVQLGEHDVDLSTLDWSKAHRGAPFRFKRGPEWVRLDDDVRLIFQGDEEVNEALKQMVHGGSYRIDSETRRAREGAAKPTAEPPKRSSAASSRRRSGRSPGSRRRS